MKTFKVSVNPIREGERASGSIMVERKRGETWTKEREITVISGVPELVIPVEDGMRLVIEPSPDTEVVYDREQGAAVRKPVDGKKLPYEEDSKESLADRAVREDREARERAAREQRTVAAKGPMPLTTATQPRPQPAIPSKDVGVSPSTPSTPVSKK